MLPSSPDSLSSSLRCLSFFSHEAPHLVHLNLWYIEVSHQLVVDGLGVLPNQLHDPPDRVTRHTREASRLAHPDALSKVLHDVDDLALWQPQIEQWRATPLRELSLAETTVQEPDGVWPVRPSQNHVARTRDAPLWALRSRAGDVENDNWQAAPPSQPSPRAK